MEFLFACYDVGGRSRLNTNELFLLLKSTSTGLSKLCGVDAPDLARLETIAGLVSTLLCFSKVADVLSPVVSCMVIELQEMWGYTGGTFDEPTHLIGC